MNEQIATPLAEKPDVRAASGRGLVWAGFGLCVLGIVLFVLQFRMKILGTPWYSPALATVGALLILASLGRRRTIGRFVALVLVAAFAGLQWFAFGVLFKLPEYTGPARAGEKLPDFHATFANGQPFTTSDLEADRPTVMVFFRGRW